MDVILLEAGRNVSSKELTEHMPEHKLQYRNLSPEVVRTPHSEMCYACMQYNYDWFVDDLQNPYSTLKDKLMAVTVRACDRLLDRFKKHEI